jgi:hypothetical protein
MFCGPMLYRGPASIAIDTPHAPDGGPWDSSGHLLTGHLDT